MLPTKKDSLVLLSDAGQ